MVDGGGNGGRTPWVLPGEPGASEVNAEKYAQHLAIHDAWPQGWPELWREAGLVWRADLFDVAEAWRGGSVPTRHLLGAVCAWGHGKRGYGPWRTGKSLDVSDLDRRLEALDPLRSERVTTAQLVTSFQAFNDHRLSRLPWFRAPFFTKLLYFAGYRRGQDTVQPLILDSVVAGRLPGDIGVRKPVGKRVPLWTSAEWMNYLVWAKDQAGHGEADTVEMRLFVGP
jgi:hypothetical protein